MRQRVKLFIGLLFTAVFILPCILADNAFAQAQTGNRRNFRVEGGVVREKSDNDDKTSEIHNYMAADSVAAESLGLTIFQFDSTRRADASARISGVANLTDTEAADSLGITVTELDSIRQVAASPSIYPEWTKADSLAADSLGVTMEEFFHTHYGQTASVSGGTQEKEELSEVDLNSMSKRKREKYERQARYADPDFVPHNKLFKDSIPISKVTWRSLVIPGYAQLYNGQAWKLPILYGTVGLSSYVWAKEQSKYNKARKRYDNFVVNNSIKDEGYRETLDPIQKRMIKKNTTRQLAMIAAIGSYVYFIAEGAVNYPGNTSSVKKATTLSTIVPGAGQIYNKSYWKAPIVIGAFATMAMTIDWNNRGYQRYKRAYDIVTNTPPGETPKDRFEGRYSADFLKNLKNDFRRNRDLCILLTGAVYILNIIDAHVDAHMKDYDISDDLVFNLEPVLMNMSMQSGGRNKNLLGLCFSLTF